LFVLLLVFAMANVGIMEGAYFVGRVELLNWLNDFLQLDYKKVEQVCTGAAYCQLVDALHPGQVPLHKVNFNAKMDYEYVPNFTILQAVFSKIGIEKKIDVPVLIKGKFQDNLEFLQWMKKYFDINWNGEPYDAKGRRRATLKVQYAGDKESGASQTSSVSATAPKAAPKVSVTPSKIKATVVASPTAKVASPLKKTAVGTKTTALPPTKKISSPATNSTSAEDKVQKLTATMEQLQQTALAIEKERDFYFGKLRQMEALCQASDQQDPVVQQILHILSAQDEELAELSQLEQPQEELVEPNDIQAVESQDEVAEATSIAQEEEEMY